MVGYQTQNAILFYPWILINSEIEASSNLT